MKYTSKNLNQVSYGESIGIILLKTVTPAIPGDVANALSFSYPVRYHVIENATIELMFTNPEKLLDKFVFAAKELEREGVKAITGDCGFMAALQQEVANSVAVPVFMSSLIQIPMILRMLCDIHKIGLITASSVSLSEKYYKGVGVNETEIERLVIGGMEKMPHFKNAFLNEQTEFDPTIIEKEVISVGSKLLYDDNKINAFLIECSVLPPYSKALQRETGLPVFDFITLIDYVQSAVVKTNDVFFQIK